LAIFGTLAPSLTYWPSVVVSLLNQCKDAVSALWCNAKSVSNQSSPINFPLVYGEPDRTTNDPGLFGPASISWQLHADPAAAIGGVRALLMQALHPEAMAGVAKHSSYKTDPWGRLARTAEYIAVITFGTTEEAHRAAARVRMVHQKLGVDRPDLLLWVHLGFVDSLLRAAQRSGLALTQAEADQYVKEQVVAADLLGAPDAPTTVAELETAIEKYLPVLGATKEAKDAARFTAFPPMSLRTRLLTPAAPAWASVAATAFALLPSWGRNMYGGGLLGPALALPILDDQGTFAIKAWRRAISFLPPQLLASPQITAAKTRLGL
jgi:uncharacterized protein (DUF2236 family)